MKNVLQSVKKLLYIMPAMIWCGIYGFILIVFGYQTVGLFSWIYPVLSLAAAVLLLKGKWWGCLPGILMGILLLARVQNEQISGFYYCLYFAAMGAICYFSSRTKEEDKETSVFFLDK